MGEVGEAGGAAYAVIDATFVLVGDTGGDTEVLLHKSYTARVPLDEMSPGALTDGLGVAWSQMLGELSADLAARGPSVD